MIEKGAAHEMALVQGHPARYTTASIDIGAIAHNLNLLRSFSSGSEIVAMVKANAYGHGIAEMALTLCGLGVRNFGVATMAEGLALRNAGVAGSILLTGGASWLFEPEPVVEKGLTPLISSVEELTVLDAAVRRLGRERVTKFHLDIDTGMSRSGMVVGSDFFGEVKKIAQLVMQNPLLALEGICTHFSSADEADLTYTHEQLRLFSHALSLVKAAGLEFTTLHVAHSAAILRGLARGGGFLRDWEDSCNFWVRPGLALYGLDPFTQPLPERFPPAPLRPALKWTAPIVGRKRIPAGTAVGYGCSFRAGRDTELALLGLGYGDGLPRSLSNRGHVVVSGTKALLVGRISMDLTVVDVTDVIEKKGFSAAEIGQEATVLGDPRDEGAMSATDMANLCGTIPYEILTSLAQRVRRTYVDGDADAAESTEPGNGQNVNIGNAFTLEGIG
jgi:alanine racemase